MATVQIFTKSSNQWRGKPLTDEDVRLWKEAVDRNKIQIPCSHDSYLINLGSVNDELWNKSIDAFVMELERAEALGLAGCGDSPGGGPGSGRGRSPGPCGRGVQSSSMTAQPGSGADLDRDDCGQGTTLGYRFDHLAYIINESQDPDRFGVCVDTCHISQLGIRSGLPPSTRRRWTSSTTLSASTRSGRSPQRQQEAAGQPR